MNCFVDIINHSIYIFRLTVLECNLSKKYDTDLYLYFYSVIVTCQKYSFYNTGATLLCEDSLHNVGIILRDCAMVKYACKT